MYFQVYEFYKKWGVLLSSLALMFFLSVCPVPSHKFTQTWKWLFRKMKKKKKKKNKKTFV